MLKKIFEYPSTLKSESKMLDDVTEFLDSAHITGNLKNVVMLCISEAFTNALTHGNKLNPKKNIIIAVMLTNSTLIADIIDEGYGGEDRIGKRKAPDLLSEGGRGIDLMNHYCTATKFHELETGGLKVTLEFDCKKSEVKNI